MYTPPPDRKSPEKVVFELREFGNFFYTGPIFQTIKIADEYQLFKKVLVFLMFPICQKMGFPLEACGAQEHWLLDVRLGLRSHGATPTTKRHPKPMGPPLPPNSTQNQWGEGEVTWVGVTGSGGDRRPMGGG